MWIAANHYTVRLRHADGNPFSQPTNPAMVKLGFDRRECCFGA